MSTAPKQPHVEEFNLLTSPIEQGLTIIEASAGTGKTYSISHLVPRLLIDGTLSKLSEFLLVTFTNDAARELAERTRRVLVRLSQPPDAEERKTPDGHLAQLRQQLAATAGASQRLEAAIRDLDQLAVSTIHSFCQRTLQQEGALCGLPVMPELTTDDSEQLNVLLRENWLTGLSTRPMLAALATGSEWKLRDALAFLRAFRSWKNSGGKDSAPPFQDLDHILAQIETDAARLKRDTPNWATVENLLKTDGVVFNKAALGSFEGVVAQIDCVLEGRADSPSFWDQLPKAADLASFINKVKSRAVSEQVAACAWVANAERIAAQLKGLEWSWHHSLAHKILPTLAEQTKRQRLITQDGLVGTLHDALNTNREQSRALAHRLAARFKVGLIDESQDTDPRQLAIFEAIFLHPRQGGRLLMIGDPKQAIYRFRGADLSTYLAARSRAQRHYSLTHTFRAPERLVQAQNAIFSRSGAFHHPDMPFTPAKSGLKGEQTLIVNERPLAPVQVWLAEADDEHLSASARRIVTMGKRISDTIIGLLQQGAVIRPTTDQQVPERKVQLDDFAVLVRDNKQAAKIAEVLEERGLPVILNSGASVFASDEAAELRDLLHAILQPTRTVRLRWALATRLLGLDATALRTFDELHSEEDRWRQVFLTWQGLWQRKGLAALWTALDTPGDALKMGISQRLAQLVPGGERRATNYRQLTDLLLEAARERLPRPADLLRWLQQRIATADQTNVPDEHQIQLASEANAVLVLTMHKSKGLEYPLVFCPTLVEPLRKPKGTQNVAVGGTHLLADMSQSGPAAPAYTAVLNAELEENLRLTYVALTRAQVGVWITSYSPKPGPGSYGAGPLDWLLRPDGEHAAHPQCSEEWITLAKDDRTLRHREVLQTLADSGIAPQPFPDAVDLRWQATHATISAVSPTLTARRAPDLPYAWSVTSFSKLTHAADAPHVPSEKSDVEATPENDDDRATTSQRPTPATTEQARPLDFMRAPRGASVGTAVHDWIEDWDFKPLASDEIAETPLARHLSRAGLPPPKEGQPEWKPCLQQLFTELRAVRLPHRGRLSPPLHELTPDPAASEWNFDLPLRDKQMFPRSLVPCFRGSGSEGADYAEALADLPPHVVSGLLTGFVDRVVCLDGEWGVIDWKTNWLGDDLAAYDEPGLRACAFDSHYWLQMHLYLVALRRWRRAAGESSPRIAGAWLVFLRGIAAETSRGILAVNPNEQLLDALDNLFAPLPDLATGGGAVRS